jgi:hypothetical protein
LIGSSIKEGKNFKPIPYDPDRCEFKCIEASKGTKEAIEKRMKEYAHAFSDQINKEREIEIDKETVKYLWRHPENLYKKEWDEYLLDIKIDSDACKVSVFNLPLN